MKSEAVIDDSMLKIRLSTLWIVVMFNMVFADIYSIIVELVNGNTFNIPGEVTTMMAIAAIVTNIPIFMIFLSRTLSRKANRVTNIITAPLTILYVIRGGHLAPHYLISAAIEVVILVYIFITVLKWKKLWMENLKKTDLIEER